MIIVIITTITTAITPPASRGNRSQHALRQLLSSEMKYFFDHAVVVLPIKQLMQIKLQTNKSQPRFTSITTNKCCRNHTIL
jgi:hypothetical protein